MAETNSPKPAVDDSKSVTEEDLRKLKYPDEEVDPPKEEVETPEGDESDKESEEASEEEEQIPDKEQEEEASADTPEFVKEFPFIKGDTPEEYAKNLEIAYKNSSSEALRLKAENEARTQAPAVTSSEPDKQDEDPDKPAVALTPEALWAKQQIDKEIQTAYTEFQKEYPQVNNADDYKVFTREVATFSRTILDSQGRLAAPAELYNMAAISLGWEKSNAPLDDKDKLDQALKNRAGTSKTPAAPSKPAPKGPQISDAQMKLNRKMYPGKTDQEIIDELTPYLPSE